MGQPMSYPARIKRIKERREELNWSQQTLVDKVFESGGLTSLGTVKRVLSTGSEEKNFKDVTLVPIEKALGLLDEEEKPVNPGTERVYRDIIQEQKEELRQARETNTVKTFFLAVLIAFEVVKVLYDRVYLDGGWFTPGNTVGWVFSVSFLVLFCGAYFGYFLYRRKKSRVDVGG